MALLVTNIRLNLLKSCNNLISISRGKKKQIAYKQFRRRDDAEEIAKDYFDTNYSKTFKEEWPSIRCALLSRKKYCSVLNNFTDIHEHEYKLMQSGAYNFISELHDRAKQKIIELNQKIEELSDAPDVSVLKQHGEVSEMEHYTENHYSNLENLKDDVCKYKAIEKSCAGVKAYVYPKQDFMEFAEERFTSLHQNFFLDASSVLPVLALDPRPGDHVLDLCSAPGGKLNIILQTLGSSGNIVANDISMQRVSRIKKVIQQFIPTDVDSRNFLRVVALDGTTWGDVESQAYTKVLVDVPCTTDRKSMYVPERDVDSIFSKHRKRERAQLPELQAALLRNAVLACCPGGTVVYSTCTASPLQNQFVVQYAVQALLQNHNVTCEVEDLRPLTSLLEEEFHFQDNLDLGALVYPRLDANFGPTYFCKLQRKT